MNILIGKLARCWLSRIYTPDGIPCNFSSLTEASCQGNAETNKCPNGIEINWSLYLSCLLGYDDKSPKTPRSKWYYVELKVLALV